MASSSGAYTVFCYILLAVGVLPSLASECSGDSCGNVISMPLMDKMKATLKADVDVTNMNNHLKAYIEQQTQKGVETAMTDVMKQLMATKLKEINTKIESTILKELKRVGVTYIRWGRKGCSGGAELVYTGQVGGSDYNTRGGGVNYLCLPNDPENGQHQSYNNIQVYGSEYRLSSSGKPSGWYESMTNMEVPCSVCFKKRRSTVLMIPGRKTCYKGWNSEYNGYLMSDHSTHYRRDYACVDKKASPLDYKKVDEHGAYFYPLRTQCGSLRCPPYTNAADVLCVVCSK